MEGRPPNILDPLPTQAALATQNNTVKSEPG
jgi:hypothetical protein